MVATSMKPANAGEEKKCWSLARTGLFAAAMAIVVEGVLLFTANSHALHGVLFDPDCYMHLQRAYHLMQGGQHMFDTRINAPFGFAIHWTMLFDLLLVAGAAPLQWLGMSPHAALYMWGCAISPFILVAALPMFAWGVRRRIEGSLFLWLTVLFFTQPQLSGAFLVGRPDHHSLVMALLLAQLAWLYAYFDRRAGTGWTLFAGVLAGIEMCTSVEALLTVFVVSAVLIFAWISFGRQTLSALSAYLGACTGTIFLWLLWQQSDTLLTPAYDHISIVHLLVLGSGFACFALLTGWNGRHRLDFLSSRLTASFALVVIAGVATASIYPDFFLGPWPHLSPAVLRWHKTVSELQPILPTDTYHAAMFLTQLSAPMLSLPLALRLCWTGTENERCIMLVTLVGVLVFGPLALAQERWSAEVQAVTLLPWTLTTCRIMQSKIAVRLGQTTLPLRSLILTGALMLQMPAAVALADSSTAAGGGKGAGATAQQTCRWTKAIKSLQPIVPQDAIVMTELWYGPEIIWRLDRRVVGGPYEISPAVADTESFLTGSESSARAIAARRGVSFVLICRADKPSGFSKQLANGVVPPWLTPVLLPVQEFRLYRVTGLGAAGRAPL